MSTQVIKQNCQKELQQRHSRESCAVDNRQIIDIDDLGEGLKIPVRDASVDYPFKSEFKTVRVNSSGVCNLNCSYCFTNSSKKKLAMTNKEVDFLFRVLGEKIFFIFTGVGDFFAGYAKQQRFLQNVLEKDSRVLLDSNGVVLHEFPELTDEQMNRIIFYDVSCHYSTMKRQNVLEKWAENAEIIASRMHKSRYIFKAIFALPEMELWPEILKFYSEQVYPKTGQPLNITLDEFDERMQSPAVLKTVNSMIRLFPDSVRQRNYQPAGKEGQTRYQVATSLDTKKREWCAAGSLYFKIDVQGDIMPCDKTGGFLAKNKLVLGNTKQEKLFYVDALFGCPEVNGPCCIKRVTQQNQKKF